MPAPAASNLLERAIAFVSPETALKRSLARRASDHMQFGYHAVSAPHSRGGSGGLYQNASPVTWQMERERIKLIWEARDQELNMPFTRGLLSRAASYAVPRVRYQALTGDKAINQVYEDFLEEEAKNADLRQQHPLAKLIELAYRSEWRDGDCGFLLSEEAGALKLEAVESDCIGNPMLISQGDLEVGGFLLNDLGQPTGVKIFRRTRTNQYVPRKNVVEGQEQDYFPISRFLHVWNPFRFGQVRGHSPLASVLPSIRDLYEVMQFDMQGIKYAASFAGFIKSANPYGTKGADAWDGKDANTGLQYMNAKSGTIVKLPDGTEYQPAPASQRPSGAFLNFVETKIREIALAIDLPFSFVWDLARFGGVAARLETRYTDQRFDYDRARLVRQIAEPWKNNVLMRGIASGVIPATKHWKRGKWNWGPRISADILNDAQARTLAIQNGLMTATDAIEEQGGDFEHITRTQAQEVKIKQQVSAETGVPIELLDRSKPNATQMIAAMNMRGDDAEAQTPPAEQGPPPPQGLLASYDPKAAKPILDLLKQLNQGLATREQAMGVLMNLYGMSAQEAAAIIPNQAPPPVAPEGARSSESSES